MVSPAEMLRDSDKFMIAFFVREGRKKVASTIQNLRSEWGKAIANRIKAQIVLSIVLDKIAVNQAKVA